MALKTSVVAVLVAVSTVIAAAQEAKTVFGFKDFSTEAALEERLMAVPQAKLAGEHLKTLTAEPHLASTPGDRKVAEYVAQKFREAGLETEIVPFRVLLNHPLEVKVEAWDAAGKPLMTGPGKEHVEGDPFEDNPDVIGAFNGSSGSGDLTAEVVYANYGRLEDFEALAAQHIDVKGKVVLVRYGQNFRGVKVYLAEQRGAAGVLIYSDPADDGFVKGEVYPMGPWRPETAFQRGSVQYLFRYSGDPETPGIASTLDLPDSKRVSSTWNQPRIPSIPLSYKDAAPILQALAGKAAPAGWQGGLKFPYHLGASGEAAVKAHLVSRQDYQRRVIWDVIGKVRGRELPDEWVVEGNHHDAWVYGAADPSSGTAAMLEAVHAVGELLKQGWRPRRTLVFGCWDAEEEGLIGSTEWVEQNIGEMGRVVAYFNTDVAVSGPDFAAAAVPSLKQFVREVAKSVKTPLGDTVYDRWKLTQAANKNEGRKSNAPPEPGGEVRVSDLGSGSDFTPFLQHAGVPATDVSSGGSYGVYHSVFDNFAWFTQNADPKFVYEEQMARVLSVELVRMGQADVLPLDYTAYARSVEAYLAQAKRKADDLGVTVDFGRADQAAGHFASSAALARGWQLGASGDLDKLSKLNHALRQAETDLTNPAGLPNRPWYRHTIYAPGEYTGYAAVVIPGVNEALDAKDPARAASQLTALAAALERAAVTLEKAR